MLYPNQAPAGGPELALTVQVMMNESDSLTAEGAL